jgi:hypothetical protein
MRDELGKDIFAASIYISNFLFALWQMDYQNLDAVPPVVIHFWSLAVEEQFYLFWPLIIVIAFKVAGRKGVRNCVAAISAVSFAWSLYLTVQSPIWAFYSLPTRAWELGVGALLIFIPARIRFSVVYPWLALALLVYSTFIFTDKTPFPGTAALAPVIGTAIAIASIGSWPAILNRLSNLRLVQWLGEISYPLYLWHWPLLVIPVVYFGRQLHIYERAFAIIATLVLADLTHRFIEEPLRHRSLPSRTIVISALTATAIAATTGIAISSSVNTTITLDTGQVYSLQEIMEKPKVYDDDCHVNNGEVVSNECTYGPATDRTIVLFGDSHAAQWFPALEKLAWQENFTLVSLTKSACPGAAVIKVDKGQYKNSDCFAWRSYAYKRIKELLPIAVIVSGMQHFEMPSGYASRAQWWQEGQAKTLKALQGSSPHLIYISDTPHPVRDIPSCVADGQLKKCNSTEKSEAIFTPGWERINPTAWFCSVTCPAIKDGVVLYRDSSHISVLASEMAAPKLLSTLKSLGVFASQ